MDSCAWFGQGAPIIMRPSCGKKIALCDKSEGKSDRQNNNHNIKTDLSLHVGLIENVDLLLLGSSVCGGIEE